MYCMRLIGKHWTISEYITYFAIRIWELKHIHIIYSYT